jgi:hypothetical protein
VMLQAPRSGSLCHIQVSGLCAVGHQAKCALNGSLVTPRWRKADSNSWSHPERNGHGAPAPTSIILRENAPSWERRRRYNPAAHLPTGEATAAGPSRATASPLSAASGRPSFAG